MSREPDERIKRIQPDRRWFGNTRVVEQQQLEQFRQDMATRVNDPYTVLMRAKKLPLGLLTTGGEGGSHQTGPSIGDLSAAPRFNLVGAESFSQTFGPKSTRKRPRLSSASSDFAALVQEAAASDSKYDVERDRDTLAARYAAETEYRSEQDSKMRVFEKGQSRRIWSELYKVIDSSDVVVQVLDVRDPLGTRSRRIEEELRRPERRHKHMVLLLNKCDLVPVWVTRRWVQILSHEYPTLAFHASITNSFGKGALIQLLRQFGQLHKDKKQICVGFVGYPNVGKSSIINTLRGSRVCRAAPVPGETKVWQYITLFRRIYLIDCPGVVYATSDHTQEESVLKGVVRVENLSDPASFVGAVLARAKTIYIQRTYGVKQWTDAENFLEQLARMRFKFLRGGEPDVQTVARSVLHDWQRGKIPFFVPPPEAANADEGAAAAESGDVAPTDLPVPQVEQLFNKIKVKLPFGTRSEAAAAVSAVGVERADKTEEAQEEVEEDVEEEEDVEDVEDEEEQQRQTEQARAPSQAASHGAHEAMIESQVAERNVGESKSDADGEEAPVADSLLDLAKTLRRDLTDAEVVGLPAKGAGANGSGAPKSGRNRRPVDWDEVYADVQADADDAALPPLEQLITPNPLGALEEVGDEDEFGAPVLSYRLRPGERVESFVAEEKAAEPARKRRRKLARKKANRLCK
jgi:nuclear GTP-binding protein